MRSATLRFRPDLFTLALLGSTQIACSAVAPAADSIPLAQEIAKIPELMATSRAMWLDGTVSARAPFLDGGAYQLQDDSGTIWVFVETASLPNVGDRVRLLGEATRAQIELNARDWGEVFVRERERF
ncbi:hypothetical protein KR51_00010450 [Rubidibacter lacunae KORDI 51-2]|uniref:Uncharacterized protein n=1 Tax=Rubidibacter lacunae KORDI 51-2 TaxID=582515 RepID=U5DKQ5_9CHRO|nr:hypothetical protein [Rubidibacter lacunae]ERN42271.1 hypothetical protein KR51_00010450 [Rubidibacter lacunae KORDI 51-2]